VGTNGSPRNGAVGESSSGEGDWRIGWQCDLARHRGNLCGDCDRRCQGLWNCRSVDDQAQSKVGGEPCQKCGVCCVGGASQRATGGWESEGSKVER